MYGGTGSRHHPGKGGKTPKNKEEKPLAWQERRRTLWALSRTAAGLLYPKGTPPSELKGVATCRWAVKSKSDGVNLHLSEYEGTGQKRASYSGLQTCGLVWRCPACAARISEARRRQVNDALSWAKGKGYGIAMMTLTARHGAGDPLKELLAAMKRAKRRFHKHRRWRTIKPRIIAVLTATEVTHGKNGWHPHFHILLIFDGEEVRAELEALGDPWRASLRREGLDGAAAAFDCQDASAAGRYVGKWGAGEELTLSGKKRANGKGRTPLQLLEAHKAGSQEAGELWLEYVQAFHGRTQLHGLKPLLRLAGLEDVTDAEAAADEAQDGQDREEEPLTNIDYPTWRERGRSRRTDILDAAEREGAPGVWAVLEKPPEPPGSDMSELIEEPPPPKPGGLAAAALAAVRRPR